MKRKGGAGLGANSRGINKRQLVMGWVAITMSMIAASFFAILAGWEGVTKGWFMGLSHLVPMLVVIIVSLVAVRWPRVGGSILILSGLCFFFSWFLVLPYSIAFFILAGLPWFFGQPCPRRLAHTLVGGFPMVVGAVTALLAVLFPAAFTSCG